MSKDLSNAGKDALVNKGIEDGKKGTYNPPNSESILSGINSAVFDSKDEKETKKAENDAYKEGWSIGRKTS